MAMATTDEKPEVPPEYGHLAYINNGSFARTLGDNLPRSCSGPKTISQLAWSSTPSSIGGLEVLPLDLIQEVLAQLDITTLLDFRRVNKQALALVESLPHYRAITTHAPSALHAIFRIQTGRSIAVQTLFDELCAWKCHHCDGFGGYLYLITCIRLCRPCFTTKNRYLPRDTTRVKAEFLLDDEITNRLPRMRLHPGKYAPGCQSITRTGPRSVLYDAGHARWTSSIIHGSKIISDILEEAYVTDQTEMQLLRYTKRVRAAEQAGRVSSLRTPRLTMLEDTNANNGFRYVAIIRVPWFDRKSQVAQWGLSCRKCLSIPVSERTYLDQFTPEGFKEHLKEHEAADS
ncbi:uncharacterized protein DNG_01494 [Cephalotrichum gorgonifer]|uniref:F-box domain-containing protein n=1 Tax=Cephalotrichum gorgonifer TaxID=2041049 RepID=A0AAE8SRQ3_9PEZI|nr:uncharacterized protein DNG_01494 [Cephalotrichum gorgonifer]